MDNIEAIEILDYMKNAYGKKPRQALDLAIKALKLSESITEEQAIDKLHETGWLIRHDKELTERPQDEWYITPDRQITIEEYMQSLKGERQ